MSGEIAAKDVKSILHEALYEQVRETFCLGSQSV